MLCALLTDAHFVHLSGPIAPNNRTKLLVESGRQATTCTEIAQSPEERGIPDGISDERSATKETEAVSEARHASTDYLGFNNPEQQPRF